MIKKAIIFDQINKGDLLGAFEALNECFNGKNDSLNALINEYIDQPNNFNKAQFLNRLKLFININFKDDNQPGKTKKNAEQDFYAALCELDFKIQTTNFQRIYKNKKIAAFLLHGEGDEKGGDVSWLCNQLLYKENLINDRFITIDMGSKIGGSFERFLEEFFIRFEIDTAGSNRTKQIAQLRSKLENKLKIDHFVCIIRSPDSILNNETELNKLLIEFLSFMDNQIVQEGHNNSLIILFTESKLADYKFNDDKYFFWFKDNVIENYPLNVVRCEDVRIIDLAPIQKITESDITKWIQWSLEYPLIYSKLCCFNGKEKDILKEGANPYQVIKRICTYLKIKIEDKWIQ